MFWKIFSLRSKNNILLKRLIRQPAAATFPHRGRLIL